MRSIPALAWVVLALTACASIAATGDRIISVTQPQFTRYSTARQTEINGKLATARFVAYSTAHSGPTGFSRPATFSNISTLASTAVQPGSDAALHSIASSLLYSRSTVDPVVGTGVVLSPASLALNVSGYAGGVPDSRNALTVSHNGSFPVTAIDGWLLADGSRLTGIVASQVGSLFSSATPAMSTTSGTAGVGTTASRGDHAHPSDTSRLTVARFSTYSASRQAQFGTVLPLSGGTLTGNVLVKPANSTTAFQVAKSDATSVFDVNTVGGNLGLGVTSFDSSAAKSLYIANGTAPAAHSTSDSVIWSESTGLKIMPSGSTNTTSIGATGASFPGNITATGYITSNKNTPGTTGAIYYDFNNSGQTTNTGAQTYLWLNPKLAQASGSATNSIAAFTPTYNQTGTQSNTDLLINRTETAVGSGPQRLISAGRTETGTYVEKFGVSNTGNVIFAVSSSPAAADACTAGTITWDASYIYVCTASGAWKRSALTGGY